MRSLLILFVVALVGCGPNPEHEAIMSGDQMDCRILRVRDCEYVTMYVGSHTLVHAGDCPNPIHRNDSLTTPHQ